jgi:hypothetical protein
MNVTINTSYRGHYAAAVLATAAHMAFGQFATPTQAQTTAAEQFGEVHFPISCSPAAQRQFDRAVAMLHSFFFPETGKAFAAIAEQEPSCAMAHWGVAISQRPNPLSMPIAPALLKRGWEAVEKAKAAGPKTERERAYVEAMEIYYKDFDKTDYRRRIVAYETAMKRLSERYPDDAEAVIFYALALNEAADPADQTFSRQITAGGLLEKLQDRMPNHPGIVHYIIHSYDYTPLAHRGLLAATRCAQLAPSAPHALHMPSHIFSMLGMWHESIQSNLVSGAAYKAYNAKNYGGAADPAVLHIMDFLIYDYLQLGQDKAAKLVLDERNAVEKFVNVRVVGEAAYAAIPVRFALERGNWKEAAGLSPRKSESGYAEAIIHFGRAIGQARDGHAMQAEPDIASIRTLKAKLVRENEHYWAAQVEILNLAASAWQAHAAGQTKEAVRLMRSAADAEATIAKTVAMENPLIPMRELLAEMLLAQNDPAGALREFEGSLKFAPNRFRSLAGAIEAAKRIGNLTAAKEFGRTLVELGAFADTDRDELVAAKRLVAGQ